VILAAGLVLVAPAVPGVLSGFQERLSRHGGQSTA
jgi:hypothetical protein